MILEFKVRNFRSIKDRQVFTMLSDRKVKEHEGALFELEDKSKVLSTAIIYGRNASGKSNLLKAIRALQYLVIGSSDLKLGEKIPPYEPYKLDKNYAVQPISLQIDFIAKDKIRYLYEVIYSENKIEYEKLTFFPKKQPAKLYERVAGKNINYGDYLTGRKKEIEDLLYPNQTFLSKVGVDRIGQLSVPYLFFKDFLYTSIFHDTQYDDVLIQVFTQKLGEANIPNFNRNMNKLMRVADTGIQEITIKEVDIDSRSLPEEMDEDTKQKIIEQYKYQIRTVHRLFEDSNEIGTTEFRLTNESTGTLKLLAIGGLILEALADGQVLIVDELDKSLHPKLTRALVNIFHNPKTNPNHAQLIFATHDVSLLKPEIFRRDQVWFVEKEFEGCSHIYSISDISGVRPDIPYDKWYMSGRFGANPVINEYELDFEF